MNPNIPTKPCFKCGIPTNQTQSIHGIAHYACYLLPRDEIGNKPRGNSLISLSDACKLMSEAVRLQLIQDYKRNEIAQSPKESGTIELWQDVQDRLDLIAATSKPTH